MINRPAVPGSKSFAPRASRAASEFHPPGASATRAGTSLPGRFAPKLKRPPDDSANLRNHRRTARNRPRAESGAPWPLDWISARGARRGALFHQGNHRQARLCGRDQRRDAARAPHAALPSLLRGNRLAFGLGQAPHRTRAARARPRSACRVGRNTRILVRELHGFPRPPLHLGTVRTADPLHLSGLRRGVRRAFLRPADPAAHAFRHRDQLFRPRADIRHQAHRRRR